MRTKAIIIKKTPVNEYDQQVTLYSEDFGFLRAMARGSLKPTSVQSLQLENFNVINFELINGRAWPIISSAHVEEQFLNLRTALPRLAAAQFFAEVLDKIAYENERDPKLWDFLLAMLRDLDGASPADLVSKFRSHQARFLEVLGYSPQISHCVVCSNDAMTGPEKMIALSPELGGVLCGECFMASGRGVLFDKSDLAALTGAPTKSSEKHSALDTFFEYTVGRKLASLALLYQVTSPSFSR